MDRKERLEYCNKCTKRSFDRNKGVVCSLTNEHADFNLTCEFFTEDEKVISKIEEQNKIKAAEKLDKETYGLSSLGITNLVTVGIIIIILSIIIQVAKIYYMNRISIYSLIFFVVGIITISKGIQRNKKKSESDNILDNNI